MMTKNQFHERNQLEMLTIEQIVLEEHLVRNIEAAIDFSFIYPMVEHLYSGLGRSSIDPVVLLKMIFIQYLFGYALCAKPLKKFKQTCFYTEVPHFSIFGKNKECRYQDSDLFKEIFYHILEKIMDKGLLSQVHLLRILPM